MNTTHLCSSIKLCECNQCLTVKLTAWKQYAKDISAYLERLHLHYCYTDRGEVCSIEDNQLTRDIEAKMIASKNVLLDLGEGVEV